MQTPDQQQRPGFPAGEPIDPLGGHSTSLRLEASFWRVLDNLAKDEGVSTPKLIETLHAEASELLYWADDASVNLASVLRTACLLVAR